MAGNSVGTARKRGPGRPFRKGQSGNPSGRAKVAVEFRAKCREISDLIFRSWASEVKTRGPNWMRASEMLAAYAYGRPTQSAEPVTPGSGEPLEFVIRLEDPPTETRALPAAVDTSDATSNPTWPGNCH